MDSSLEGQYANDDASKLIDLASKCLQFEARDRPNSKFILSAVEPLQTQKEVLFFLTNMILDNMLLFYVPSIFRRSKSLCIAGGISCSDGSV